MEWRKIPKHLSDSRQLVVAESAKSVGNLLNNSAQQLDEITRMCSGLAKGGGKAQTQTNLKNPLKLNLARV